MNSGRFKQLGWTSALIALIGLGAKVVAFARELVIADQFGATRETDTWFLVFALWIQTGLALVSMASKTVIPPLLEAQEQGGDIALRRLLGGITWATTASLVAVAVLAHVFAPEAIGFFGSEFEASDLAHGVDLFRICIPALPLIGVASVFVAVGRARGQFLLVEISRVAINVCTLAVLLIAGRAMGISAAALGATLGSAAMLMICFAYLWKENLTPMWAPGTTWVGLRLLGLTALLVWIGNSGGFLMVVVTRYFYTLLPAGQFSCQGYALRVITLPTQILMPAVLTTVLPVLAAAIARKDLLEGERLGNRAMRMLLASMIPVILYLVMVREPLVRAMFHRGAFKEDDVQLTAILVAALVPYIVVAMARNVVATVFYSHQSVVWPTVAGMAGVVLYGGFAWFVWEPYGAVGLALAQGISDGLSLLISLYVGRKVLGLRWPGLGRWSVKLALVCVPAMAVAAAVRRAAEAAQVQGLAWQLAEIAGTGILCGVVFLATARVAGLREVDDIAQIVVGRVRRRLGR
jgi:putative peptidoglycan lipid II flippase